MCPAAISVAGKATINSMYGTRVAVLAGDYLFAQSSWFLANLENIEVIKLISQVIADFANGEISQVSEDLKARSHIGIRHLFPVPALTALVNL
jgi:geranylgeranyl pyrophosphate synthase